MGVVPAALGLAHYSQIDTRFERWHGGFADTHSSILERERAVAHQIGGFGGLVSPSLVSPDVVSSWAHQCGRTPNWWTQLD